MNIEALQTWYQLNKRDLPFRSSQNPYFIWVSEIMAQQTQMETVVPYFLRYIAKYPTIHDLAIADEDELHKLFEGIGYYRRFQYMQKAAKQIDELHHGEFPSTYEAVRALPGVGEYTAGAIMSIAFNQHYAATDGNVIRVLSRFYGIDDDMKDDKSRKKIHALNQTLITKATPNIYTQAMMELGALVCKPSHPSCECCPLQKDCFAYINKKTDVLPVISRKISTKVRHFTTTIIEQDHRIAVYKNAEGLLKGMYLFPQYEDVDIEEVQKLLFEQGYTITQVEYLKAYRHVFSHQTWVMKVYRLKVFARSNASMHNFVEDIHSVPMAIAHRKIKTVLD